jgi:RNA polymerase sigma-70 factor (ECF subfamily)
MRERSLAMAATPLTLTAFTEMVDRHQHALSTFLRNLVGDAEQAYDLMQDTLQEAWRAVRVGTDPFIAECSDEQRRRWLFQVAYHRGISALRHHRLIRWESLDLLHETGAEPGSDADSREERFADGEALRAALARLAPQDAACLLLRIAHGFSAVEVGQMMGVSPAVVTKRLSRAKQRLRAVYLAHNAEEDHR